MSTSTPRQRVAAGLRAHPLEIAVATVLVALKVVYLVRALQPGHNDGLHLVLGSDSPTYTNGAHLSIFSKSFYEQPGPFGFLVLLKLVRENVRALVIVQTLLSCVAWISLALAVRSALRSAVARFVGYAGIMATGLAPAFIMYDVAVATESLAVSLACIVLALAIRLAVRADRRTVVAFVVALIAAAFTHDVDAILAGGVGAVALLALVVPRWRATHTRRLLAVGLTLVIVAGVETELSTAARRWYWPTAETIIYRVAEYPGGYEWLVAHGMPNDGAVRLMQREGYFLTYAGFQADEPNYHALRHWLDERGRSSYMQFLVSHPKYTLFEPRHTLADQLTPGVASIAAAQDMRADVVTRAIGWIGLPSFRVTVVWDVLALGGLVGATWAAWADSQRRRVGIVLLGLAVIVAPHALAVFHGDALELGRHSLSVALQARVVAWAATAFALDVLLARGRQKEA